MEYSTILSCFLIAVLWKGVATDVITGCYDVTCYEPAYNISSSDMEAGQCDRICSLRGFYYAGYYNGTECWCSNDPPSCESDKSSVTDRCGVPCAGNYETFCGGLNAVRVHSYQNDHPVVGDWRFNGSNSIVECSSNTVLDIVLTTAVKGDNLTGQWQLATWGSNNLYNFSERYHEAALSISFRDDPTSGFSSALQTLPKRIRWDTERGPPCDELGFLCVQLRRINDSANVTIPRASCHKITCKRNLIRGFECEDRQCSCVDRVVVYPTPNPTMPADEEKLAAIKKDNITEETADEVLNDIISLTYDDFKADAVTSTTNVLESVVSLNSSDTKITKGVVEIIGKLMNSDPEELAAAQGMSQSSSRAMQALEQQLQVVDLSKNNGSFTSVQPNLAVQVQETTPDVLKEGLTFVSRRSTIDDRLTDDDITVFDHSDEAPIDANDLRASVNVKTQFVDELDNTSRSSDIRIAFAVVREPSLFISNVDDHGFGSDGARTGRRRPNTPVISVTIEGSGLRKVQTEVTSAFHPIQTSNGSMIIDDPICVFWDFGANNGTGDWSDYGCSLLLNETDITNSTTILCTCNHTTNFAVIMNFHSPEPSVTFQRASKFLSFIGCGLSIGSLIITLAVYILSPKLRQKQPNQIFMNICLSLLFLYLTYIMVVIFNRQQNEVVESNDVTDREKKVKVGCFCLAALIQYFTLTSLVWMGVEGVNMYLLFVKVVNATITGFMTKASLIAWGLPIIAVTITWGIARHEYADPQMCFLAKIPKIGGLLCPVGVIIVANFIIFTLVVIRLGRTIRTSSAKTDSVVKRVKEGQQRLQKAICIFLLLGLTWSSGYLLLAGTVFNHVFQIVFIILNSFQGFFIFVIYCLRQRVVRAELSRLCGCAASRKRRSISIASTGQREDTMKTRQTEMASTTIGPTFQGIEVDMTDGEDAEEHLETETSTYGAVHPKGDADSRPGSTVQRKKRRPMTSTDRIKQRSSSCLGFAEIRKRLEEVLSKRNVNRRQKQDLSSQCWVENQRNKPRSLRQIEPQ